jgi:hypothetical protein
LFSATSAISELVIGLSIVAPPVSVPVTATPVLVTATTVAPADCKDMLPVVSDVMTRPAEVEELRVTAIEIS